MNISIVNYYEYFMIIRFINYHLVVREPWLRGEGETVHGIPAGDAS